VIRIMILLKFPKTREATLNDLKNLFDCERCQPLRGQCHQFRIAWRWKQLKAHGLNMWRLIFESIKNSLHFWWVIASLSFRLQDL
jgi:hypothetical protein